MDWLRVLALFHVVILVLVLSIGRADPDSITTPSVPVIAIDRREEIFTLSIGDKTYSEGEVRPILQGFSALRPNVRIWLRASSSTTVKDLMRGVKLLQECGITNLIVCGVVGSIDSQMAESDYGWHHYEEVIKNLTEELGIME